MMKNIQWRRINAAKEKKFFFFQIKKKPEKFVLFGKSFIIIGRYSTLFQCVIFFKVRKKLEVSDTLYANTFKAHFLR
jgi:hypothetical protein